MKKTCNSCKHLKPINDFYKQNNGKFGRKAVCKDCYKPKSKLATEKRKKLMNAVPNKLRDHEAEKIRSDYQYECALTCKQSDIGLDHFVPLSWGKSVNKYGIGGTTYANMIPFHRSINSSKHAMNPFVWFDRYGERHGVSIDKWNSAVQYIAEKHNMIPFDYINRVNTCYSEVLALRWVDEVNSSLESYDYVHPFFINKALRIGLNIPVIIEKFGSEKTKESFLQNETINLINQRKSDLC